jgi:hypothetical protein
MQPEQDTKQHAPAPGTAATAEAPAASVEETAHAAAAAEATVRAAREIDAFVARLDLYGRERSAVLWLAAQVRATVQAGLGIALGVADMEADEEAARRIRASALAVALMVTEANDRHRTEVCPCARCARDRSLALGWRGRLRLRWIGLRSRLRRGRA